MLNLKYVDAAGFPEELHARRHEVPGLPPGRAIAMVADRQPARCVTHPIRTDVRRRDQTITDFNAYQNAGVGRFDNGLSIFIRRGSLATPNNPNTGIWYVRVRGPALPMAGMVLADLPSANTGEGMGFLRADGVIPTGPQQLVGAGATSTLLLQRTVGP